MDVGSVTVRIRNGKSIGIYSVQSVKAFTDVIIRHFNEYPLLSQKQTDFIGFIPFSVKCFLFYIK